MIVKKLLKSVFGKKTMIGGFFVIFGLLGLLAPVTAQTVYADDEAVQTTETTQEGADCKKSMGAVGWLACPSTGKIAEGVDWFYGLIERFLEVEPVSAEDGSPIYEIWKYLKGIANIVFVIFLLVVVYSYLTGIGISNYDIKKALPKLIIATVLMNMSFSICLLAVDISNILGNGLRGVFTGIEQAAIPAGFEVSYGEIFAAILGGGAVTIGAVVLAVMTGAIWMLIPVVLGAIVAVVIGFVTIALRQAVIILLIMISPLAMIAFVLPNTEKWFNKWKDLFGKMLIFYPMFALLFGASELAGFAIIASAKDVLSVLLGIAVQIFPLFFSVSLMKMSGTFLETINSRMHGFASAPLAANRSWADSHRQLSKQKFLASGGRMAMPFVWMNNRKAKREAELGEAEKLVKSNTDVAVVNARYDKNGRLTKVGEEYYRRQIRMKQNEARIEWDKVNFNKGVAHFARDAEHKVELEKLDAEMTEASDNLTAQKVRGEKVEYENALDYHKRMDNAIRAHLYGTGTAADIAKYNAMKQIMDGSEEGVHFVAAGAAQGFDTQKKIVEAKYQKYFEMTPASADVNRRLNEISKLKNATDYIDPIISGMKVLNQRGDMGLVKNQVLNVCNSENGLKLGTYASQQMGNFLAFEVKDKDPFLRRFGAYINVETANMFDGGRKVENVTYDEYLKGYHEGEPDMKSPENPNGRMDAKKEMKKLLTGTSFDEVEKEAFESFDDSLKEAFGYPDENWDVDGYVDRRKEVQQAFAGAFGKASSTKWEGGSDQMAAGLEFWFGYKQKQQKKKVKTKDGAIVEQLVVDKNGKPVFDLIPAWENEDNKFNKHSGVVSEFYRKQAKEFIKGQTPTQILGLRGDFLGPMVEHLVEMYNEPFSDEAEKLSKKETDKYARRKFDYEKRMAKIKASYTDMPHEAAEEKRRSEIWKYKQEIAGRQLREILDKNGTLEQIYTTRKSGAANNAKDWLRNMLNLDDKAAIYEYLNKKSQKAAKEKQQEQDFDTQAAGLKSPYADINFRRGLLAELDLMRENHNGADEVFYNDTYEKMVKTFGGDSIVVKQYEKFYENNPGADSEEMFDALEEILSEFFTDNA